jgi:hypothetical protein
MSAKAEKCRRGPDDDSVTVAADDVELGLCKKIHCNKPVVSLSAPCQEVGVDHADS